VNREAGAVNVKWVFHVNATSDPAPDPDNKQDLWNSIENYYPDKECAGVKECARVVDAVGLSVYGAQKKGDECRSSFFEKIDGVLTGNDRWKEDSLKQIGTEKPVYVLEFGQTLLVDGAGQPDSNCNAGKWARDALTVLFDASKWPEIKLAGFSWWNEAWVNDKDEDAPASVTDMRVNSFNLCPALSGKHQRIVKEAGMDCRCWEEGERRFDDATELAKCQGLRANRAHLRRSLLDVFNAHTTLLRESPAGL
jgi:hypothetical protein